MEFHAIVLCGQGQRLAPFAGTESPDTPKGLLSVNNKPLVGYALDWCVKGNFNRVTLVSSKAEKASYSAFVREYIPNNSQVDVMGIDADTTGKIIAALRDEIKTDFVVLPCDFITSVDALTLTDAHRRQDDDNVLISGVYYKNNLENIEKKALVADYILHTPLTDSPPTLLDVYNREAVSSKKSMQVRMGMLWRYANTVASTQILRAAIYFCSNRIFEILDNDVKDWKDKSWNKVVRDVARRSWRHEQPKEIVSMSIFPEDETFVRANNLSAYMEANRYVLKVNAKAKATNANNAAAAPASATQAPAPGAAGGNKPKANSQVATVGADSTVGKDTTLGEKSSVKRSVVGNGCNIGKKCRLTGCVVLDNVTIHDDVVMENCLIGKGATILNKSKLTSCNVEEGLQVSQNTQAKNETLVKVRIGSMGNSDEDSDYAEGSGLSEDEDSDEDDDGSEHWEASEGEDLNDDEDDDGLFDRS